MTISFILTSYKVIVELSNGFDFVITRRHFAELFGFEKKSCYNTEMGSKLPNITNSIDLIHVNTMQSWIQL